MQLSGEGLSRFSTAGLTTVYQASNQLSRDKGRHGRGGEEYGSAASNGVPALPYGHFESPKVKTSIGPEALQRRLHGRTRNYRISSV